MWSFEGVWVMRRRWLRFALVLPALAFSLSIPAQDEDAGDAPEQAVADEPAPEPLVPRRLIPVAPFGHPIRAVKEPGQCRYLAFSRNSAFLASSNQLGQTGLFDLLTGELIWTWTAPPLLASSKGDLLWPAVPLAQSAWVGGRWTFPPCDGWPGGVRAMFSPTDDTLAIIHNPTLSHSHFIVATNGEATRELGSWMTGGYVHLFAGPDLEHKASIETEGIFKFPPEMPSVMHGLPGISAADYSPDGLRIATGSTDGLLRLWFREGGAACGAVRVDGDPELSQTSQPLLDSPHGNGVVRDVDFSPDGSLIATVGDSGIVGIYTTDVLAKLREFAEASDRGFWVEFSSDGGQVASASEDGWLRVWDVGSGALVATFDWRDANIGRPVFTYGTDGRSILFGGTRDGGVIGLIDSTSGTLSGPWATSLPDIAAFALSPCGDLMAAGCEDGDILIWRLQAGPFDQRLADAP